MEKNKKKFWAIIPARGGSKTIKLKNMAELCGRPLIDYVIKAAKGSKNVDRIICSTDHEKIKQYCLINAIEIHRRPEELADDYTALEDVLIQLLNEINEKEARLPYAIVTMMPTSPFILPRHIDLCIESMLLNNRANSAQTIATFTHNHHAYNQREIVNGCVNFKFLKQRKKCHSKQVKPKFYSFGNVVVTKVKALLNKKGVFARPSVPHEIPSYYAVDADGPEEFELANWYLETGKVEIEI